MALETGASTSSPEKTEPKTSKRIRPHVNPMPVTDPTPEKVKKNNTNLRKRIVAGSIVGSALLAELTGAAVTELSNEVPISAHTLQIDVMHPWNIGLSEIVPPTFDKDSRNGVVGSNNMIAINEEALKNIKTVPETPTAKHDVYVPFPSLNFPTDKSVNYNRSFTGQNQPLYGSDATKYAKEQGIQDRTIWRDMPAGTIIPVLADGLMSYVARPEVAPSGNINAINIFYKNPADGVLIQITIGMKDGSPMKPLVDAEPFTYKEGTNSGEYYNTEVKRGSTPLVMTLKDGDIQINGKAWPSGQIGVGSSSVYPVNLNVITVTDNTGNNKVAALQ